MNSVVVNFSVFGFLSAFTVYKSFIYLPKSRRDENVDELARPVIENAHARDDGVVGKGRRFFHLMGSSKELYSVFSDGKILENPHTDQLAIEKLVNRCSVLIERDLPGGIRRDLLLLRVHAYRVLYEKNGKVEAVRNMERDLQRALTLDPSIPGGQEDLESCRQLLALWRKAKDEGEEVINQGMELVALIEVNQLISQKTTCSPEKLIEIASNMINANPSSDIGCNLRAFAKMRIYDALKVSGGAFALMKELLRQAGVDIAKAREIAPDDPNYELLEGQIIEAKQNLPIKGSKLRNVALKANTLIRTPSTAITLMRGEVPAATLRRNQKRMLLSAPARPLAVNGSILSDFEQKIKGRLGHRKFHYEKKGYASRILKSWQENNWPFNQKDVQKIIEKSYKWNRKQKVSDRIEWRDLHDRLIAYLGTDQGKLVREGSQKLEMNNVMTTALPQVPVEAKRQAEVLTQPSFNLLHLLTQIKREPKVVAEEVLKSFAQPLLQGDRELEQFLTHIRTVLERLPNEMVQEWMEKIPGLPAHEFAIGWNQSLGYNLEAVLSHFQQCSSQHLIILKEQETKKLMVEKEHSMQVQIDRPDLAATNALIAWFKRLLSELHSKENESRRALKSGELNDLLELLVKNSETLFKSSLAAEQCSLTAEQSSLIKSLKKGVINESRKGFEFKSLRPLKALSKEIEGLDNDEKLTEVTVPLNTLRSLLAPIDRSKDLRNIFSILGWFPAGLAAPLQWLGTFALSQKKGQAKLGEFIGKQLVSALGKSKAFKNEEAYAVLDEIAPDLSKAITILIPSFLNQHELLDASKWQTYVRVLSLVPSSETEAENNEVNQIFLSCIETLTNTLLKGGILPKCVDSVLNKLNELGSTSS